LRFPCDFLAISLRFPCDFFALQIQFPSDFFETKVRCLSNQIAIWTMTIFGWGNIELRQFMGSTASQAAVKRW
ncbi:MAG TPA: hypothetical protein VIY48_03610, partial [Candidatus Paceibacterota bacterium]